MAQAAPIYAKHNSGTMSAIDNSARCTPGAARARRCLACSHAADRIFRGAEFQLRHFQLWHRLLRRSASESGRLCHGDADREWGARRPRALMLPILRSTNRVSRSRSYI